jgi:hypothetical protein
MSDLLVAFGLVLVIEGLVWAVSPDFGRGLLAQAAQMPDQSLRTGGIVAVALGCLVVWLIRG